MTMSAIFAPSQAGVLLPQSEGNLVAWIDGVAHVMASRWVMLLPYCTTRFCFKLKPKSLLTTNQSPPPSQGGL